MGKPEAVKEVEGEINLFCWKGWPELIGLYSPAGRADGMGTDEANKDFGWEVYRANPEVQKADFEIQEVDHKLGTEAPRILSLANDTEEIISSEMHNAAISITTRNLTTSNNKFFSYEKENNKFSHKLKDDEEILEDNVMQNKENSFRLALVKDNSTGKANYMGVDEKHRLFKYIIPCKMDMKHKGNNRYMEVHKNQGDQTFSVIMALENNRLLLSEITRLENESNKDLWYNTMKDDYTVLKIPQTTPQIKNRVVKSVFDCNKNKQLHKGDCTQVAVLVENILESGEAYGNYMIYLANYFRNAEGKLQTENVTRVFSFTSLNIGYNHLIFNADIRQIAVVGVGHEETEKLKNVLAVKLVAYASGDAQSQEKIYPLKRGPISKAQVQMQPAPVPTTTTANPQSAANQAEPRETTEPAPLPPVARGETVRLSDLLAATESPAPTPAEPPKAALPFVEAPEKEPEQRCFKSPLIFSVKFPHNVNQQVIAVRGFSNLIVIEIALGILFAKCRFISWVDYVFRGDFLTDDHGIQCIGNVTNSMDLEKVEGEKFKNEVEKDDEERVPVEPEAAKGKSKKPKRSQKLKQKNSIGSGLRQIVVAFSQRKLVKLTLNSKLLGFKKLKSQHHQSSSIN